MRKEQESLRLTHCGMRKCGFPTSGSLSIALRGLVVEPLSAIHEVLRSTTKKKKQPPPNFEIKKLAEADRDNAHRSFL